MFHDVLRGPAVVFIGLATMFAGCASNPILKRNNSAKWASLEYQRGIVKGKLAEQARKWDRAHDIYEKLVAGNPHNAEAYHRLGVIADREKNFDRAHEYFSQAIRLDPKNAEIWSDLGYCLYLKGDLEQAESALFKAVAIAPGTARFHNNLGMVYGHLDREDEALAEFGRTGSEADAFFNLAYIYSARENIEKATACIERCLAIDPTHKEARYALESLTNPEQAGGVMPASYEEKDGVHWIPYVQGMESQEATIIGNQMASGSNSQSGSPNQSLSPNRTAGNRVRQLQTRTQAIMNNRMNRPSAASQAEGANDAASN